jgi:hypothetical protein
MICTGYAYGHCNTYINELVLHSFVLKFYKDLALFPKHVAVQYLL